MNARTTIAVGLKIVILTVLYMIVFVAASGIAIAPSLAGQPSADAAGGAAQALPAVSVLNTAVLAYIILRSRWSGWRLSAAVAFSFYGAYTFMAQIETVAFPAVASRLPLGMVPGLFLMGILMAVPFAPLAVLILGKWRPGPLADAPNTRLAMPLRQWAWKLAAVAAIYVVLYFTFGYYLAWKNPAVHTYYGGTDPGSFLLQMGNVWRDTPWLPFFQALRAMLWVLFALPVIRMMKGRPWEAGLAVALLYSVIMNSQHLFANPYWPSAVRYAHLIETASSNFIFGCLVTWLLHRRHASVRDLFMGPTVVRQPPEAAVASTPR